MANTQYGVNHPLAVKLWSRKLFQEALKQTWMSKFIGTDSNSVIQKLEDTQKGPGDRITQGLRVQLSGNGVSGDGTLEGNEEALTTYSDNVLIDQLRHAVRSSGKMSEQRIPFSVREEARMGLTDWWADRIDTALFNQLSGNTTQSDTKFTGSNATVAPSSGNIIYGDGQSTEANVISHSASAIMSLKYIDYAVEKAKTMSPMIRPVKINGEDKYVLFLHPYQVTDLRVSTSTGQWLDIQKAAMQGGQVSNNPIYTGALGEYNGVVLHMSTRIPRTTVASDATSTTNAGAYRAVFCGAQAGLLAFGQNSSENKTTWVEEMFDYGNQLGVSAGMIWGAKKAVFNSADFGTIVIATYAAAHA
jgi:N4-gp56 family major capsid protein